MPNLSRNLSGAAVGLSLALCGCKLVDQTTFYPPPPAAAKPAPAPAAPVVNDALLTISLAHGDPTYQQALAQAAAAAVAAKPNVIFDIVSWVPQQGDVPPTWDQAEQVTKWGRSIATDLEHDGVEPGQIRLGVRAVPGLDHGEIRVYVR